jgi:hypothetical protein
MTTAVGSLYRLSAVGPSNLPAPYVDSANYQLRVFADTLALTRLRLVWTVDSVPGLQATLGS